VLIVFNFLIDTRVPSATRSREMQDEKDYEALGLYVQRVWEGAGRDDFVARVANEMHAWSVAAKADGATYTLTRRGDADSDPIIRVLAEARRLLEIMVIRFNRSHASPLSLFEDDEATFVVALFVHRYLFAQKQTPVKDKQFRYLLGTKNQKAEPLAEAAVRFLYTDQGVDGQGPRHALVPLRKNPNLFLVPHYVNLEQQLQYAQDLFHREQQSNTAPNEHTMAYRLALDSVQSDTSRLALLYRLYPTLQVLLPLCYETQWDRPLKYVFYAPEGRQGRRPVYMFDDEARKTRDALFYYEGEASGVSVAHHLIQRLRSVIQQHDNEERRRNKIRQLCDELHGRTTEGPDFFANDIDVKIL
jgi:hypothetical protein